MQGFLRDYSIHLGIYGACVQTLALLFGALNALILWFETHRVLSSIVTCLYSVLFYIHWEYDREVRRVLAKVERGDGHDGDHA